MKPSLVAQTRTASRNARGSAANGRFSRHGPRDFEVSVEDSRPPSGGGPQQWEKERYCYGSGHA